MAEPPLQFDSEDIVEVVNRTGREYLTMFNAKPIHFKPRESKHMLYRIAINICVNSYNSISHPTGIPQHYKLAIKGLHDCSPLPLPHDQVEVLDRSNQEQLRHSEPKVLTQGGVEEMGIGKLADERLGHSPVRAPLPDAGTKLTSAQKKKLKGKFQKTKALEFQNEPERSQAGQGLAIAVGPKA